MNINEFTAFAAEEVLKCLPEEMRDSVSVETAEVMKINDQIMHGLAFHKGDEPAPTFYLDDLFEIYQHGENPKEILRGLVDTYVDCYAYADAGNEEVPIPAEIPDLSYEGIRKMISVRLLGMDYNKRFLETVPYRDVGNGYALVSEIQVEASDDGIFSTVITNAMAEEYAYDMKRVFDTALENVWRADVLNEDYIAIPSSLHEFIIVRKGVVADSHHLRQLVKEANHIIVRPEDVLSDNILYYCKSSQSISVL